MHYRAQGATEYLVLLAVVLIVALVSVALLGFFPGMASDAQITQSQAYWQGASPIAIVEAVARYDSVASDVFPYIRMRNTGAYPIRITGVVGADNAVATQFYADPDLCGMSAGAYSISNYFYMAPGEEKYFIYRNSYGSPLPCDREIRARTGASTGYYVGGAGSVCQNSNSTPGMMIYNSFGFQYIEYIEGQQITKKQIGKAFVVKCQPPR